MFAGRKEEIQKVEGWLKQRRSVNRRLLVISIEGPGGIGKTMLITQALNSVRQAPEYLEQGYLEMRTEGGAEVDDPAQWISAAAQSCAKSRSGGVKGTFPGTMKTIGHINAITESTRRELSKSKLSPDQLDVAKTIVQGGIGIMKRVPKLKQYAPDMTDAEHERLAGTLSKLKAMDPSGLLTQLNRRRNAVRRDPDGELARAFVQDLERIFGPNRKRKGGLEHNRLLWILDDYEAFPSNAHLFFVEHLVPELDTAEFETTIVLMGRDHLWDTHSSWSRRFRHVYADTVLPLKPFSQLEIQQLCGAGGIKDEDVISRIARESSGFPLLVDWAVREVTLGGKGIRAPALQNFYDRITQWMNEEEKKWFDEIVFLPKIDKTTLAGAFPGASAEKLTAILEWFKREASVRESTAQVWQVRPYVQSRVLKLFAIDDPARVHGRLAETKLNWRDPFESATPEQTAEGLPD